MNSVHILLAAMTGLILSAASLAQGDKMQTPTYEERYRPQFHFSAKKNWLNDPNGCVFYDGEYHLFFQHNPKGIKWGNMTWGHAVSTDLVHWRQLPDAIVPYDGGTVFSGSAVVDSHNLSGFGKGQQQPLVAVFTHARKPFGQAIAYSTDKGRTWELYAKGKHVIPNQGLDGGERDPKVFWHDPSRKWIAVLWVRKGTARFFASDDLKQWTHTSDFVVKNFYECPDMYALPVDGNHQNMKWVLHDAAFNYWIGMFDGRQFVPEEGPISGDLGANFYAAQSWSNTAPRVVHIAWMRDGKYPGMPFNQQMSFPCQLELRTLSDGIRLCRTPVKEIENLYTEHFTLKDKPLKLDENLLAGISGDLFDIEMEIVPGQADEFGLRLHDRAITYAAGKVSCLGRSAPLSPVDGTVTLRILVDRTSLEVFGNNGEISLTSCFLPKNLETKLELYAMGANAHIKSLKVRKLRSAWKKKE